MSRLHLAQGKGELLKEGLKRGLVLALCWAWKMPAAQVRLPGTGVAKDGQKHLSFRSEYPAVLLGDEMIGLALGGKHWGTWL